VFGSISHSTPPEPMSGHNIKMQGGLHETLPKPYQLSNLQKSTCAQRKRLYCTKGSYIL
jgi:hypothetical protein